MKATFPRLSRIWTQSARRSTALALCCAFSLVVSLGAVPAKAADDPQLAQILRQLQAINSMLGQMVDPEFSVVYSYPLYYDEGFEDLGQRMAKGFDDVVAALQQQGAAPWTDILNRLGSIDANTDQDDELRELREALLSIESYMDTCRGI